MGLEISSRGEKERKNYMENAQLVVINVQPFSEGERFRISLFPSWVWSSQGKL
jgi:hypothetical protein